MPTKRKKQCGDCYKLPKPLLTANIRIDPTAQLFSVRIIFAIPPELEKQLPKELQPPGSTAIATSRLAFRVLSSLERLNTE